MTAEGDIKDIWIAIEAWLGSHAPARAAELKPGASASALAALEKSTGLTLPADYAASLKVHDGSASLSDYVYLSSEAAKDEWIRLRALPTDGRQIDNPEAGIIKPVWWHPGWLPFAKDSGANLLCLDLDPGPRGVVGQVLTFERSMGPGPAGPASFLDWLRAYRDALLDGSLVADEEGFIHDNG